MSKSLVGSSSTNTLEGRANKRASSKRLRSPPESDFTGTLFLVSHDRAFLENTVTQVIAFEGNGILTEFGGGFDDWQRFSQQRAQANRAEDKRLSELAQSTKAQSKPAPVKAASKLSFKEEKELADIPSNIEQLETEQAEINTQLADSEIYKTQADLVKTLQARLVEIDGLLEALLARWEVLDAKQG
jgi:ATP-binding cassette subfamily F protein uup